MKRSALPLAFVTGFLAVGIPYWLIPYNRLNLPDALLGAGLVVVAISAFALRVSEVARLWRAANVMAAAVPAVVIARVIVDAIKDPTSHNLWPLELIIAALLGYACALAGAICGSLIARAFGRT